MQPYITGQFKTLVQRVSTKLLATLTAANGDIQAISYEHGRKFDITQLLKVKDESSNFSTKQTVYPMVWLYEPITIRESPVIGCVGRVLLNVAVFFPTQQEYTPDERYENIFKPVLDPIVDELFTQIDKSGWYHLYDVGSLKHNVTRRMMWGTDANKNELQTIVDAVEINGLELDLYPVDECES